MAPDAPTSSGGSAPGPEDRSPAVESDWGVVAPEALIARVEGLLARMDEGEAFPGSVPTAGLAALVSPVHQMRLLHAGLHPPEVAAGGGPRRRAGGFLKRLVRRLTSWYVEPRWLVQEQLDAKSIEFSAEAYNSVHRIEAELERLRQQNVRLRLDLVANTERMRRTQEKVAEGAERLAKIESTLSRAAMEDEFRALSKEVAAILARFGADGTTGADIDYVEFERRFRGDAADIAEGQHRYVALFPPAMLPGQIVDIGCGRGEMLELLAAEGHEVLGVDMDPDMVVVCHGKGLPAVVDDGVHFLSRTPDNSLKGVFCAQVVEHLITPELEALVSQAHRALAPDGALVIETINPRSSYALGNHYYADTSHVRPVHPETLRFICEQVGFTRVELEERSPHPSMSLRESLPEGPVGEAVESLLESVFGYQDYVIVANK
ncbi:MAG: class I SAM-dependent methyltransferase [Acidimicrobiales bacterium]